VDGHAVLANSAALLIAGINEETKIQGGKVLIKDGRTTGILLDNAADRMKALIPRPDNTAKAKALTEAQHDCFRNGLTSVVDAGLFYHEVLMVDSLQQDGKFKLRINAMLSPEDKNISEFVEKGPFMKERLTVNSIKLYADGALGSRGALLLEPYTDDPGNFGLRMSEPEYFRQILSVAFEK
jgi:predicted amidohydrolase YtcJ